MRSLRILILCNRMIFNAGVLKDHIDSFSHHSQHHIYVLSRLGDLPNSVDLSAFDVIVIHFTHYILGTRYLSAQAKDRIKNFTGLKAIFVQDEYRMVTPITEELMGLGCDVLFTCVDSRDIETVYPKSLTGDLKKVSVLTGYVTDDLIQAQITPFKERSCELGYRGRKNEFWLGETTHYKWKLVDLLKEPLQKEGLNIDLSYKEEDRIYGQAWGKFLKNLRATLVTPSSSEVLDRTGELQKSVRKYLSENTNASFDDVYTQFVSKFDHQVHCIFPPKIFEAAAFKVPLVMLEGDYSEVLEPGEHYFELKKDSSNFDDLVSFLKNDDALIVMADKAHKHLIESDRYSYKTFIKKFDEIISDEFVARQKSCASKEYDWMSWELIRLRFVLGHKVGRILKVFWSCFKKMRFCFRDELRRQEV